jgi:hypothetical protein
MWRAVWLLVVGCGFRHGTATGDAVIGMTDGSADAAVDALEIDAPLDAPPDGPPPPIMFQQGSGAVTSTMNVNVPFPNAQLYRSMNVVFICWINNDTVTSVHDASGNTYALALGRTTLNGMNLTAYYACGVAGTATNTVMVTFASAPTQSDVRIAEYSGIAATGCLDQASAAANNTIAELSAPVTTAFPHDLLVAGNCTFSTTTAADPLYTSRGIDSFGDLVEDRVVFSSGTDTAAATQNNVNDWVIDLLAFKGK